MATKDVFESACRQFLALTYDDVRLRTGYSEVLPAGVRLDSLFSKRVPLKIPFVSAAMDTVTERSMAIAMAMAGGLGIIHKNLSPEAQAKEVRKVKLFTNGLIESPKTVTPQQKIGDVEQWRQEKRYQFHSFPVVSPEIELLGLVTGNDFFFGLENPDQLVAAVMTPFEQVITAPFTITQEDAYQLMREHRKKVLPLIDDNRRLRAQYLASDLQRVLRADAYGYNVDGRNQLRVGAAIGVGADTRDRVQLLIKSGVDVLVIDTAHGDSKNVITMLELIKSEHDIDVVVGNVSEASSVERLVAAGADGIKVGQGGGSICTTRPVAGVGCPQGSAVYASCQAATGVPVCADGGITQTGDTAIAIGIGAHSVMMGSALAGTDEAPGEEIIINGAKHKVYRGMGSEGAMRDHRASRERYGQADVGKLVPEGIEGAILYRGSVAEVLGYYVGGLRAGMAYVGAATTDEMREKAQFHRITAAGARESHPHDVLIIKDAPNYRQ